MTDTAWGSPNAVYAGAAGIQSQVFLLVFGEEADVFTKKMEQAQRSRHSVHSHGDNHRRAAKQEYSEHED